MSERKEDSIKKNYDFTEVELKWKKFWETNKIFKFDSNKKNIYSIDTPPPTVSGNMHIGHAFSYSQQDFIARYKRMNQGVYYPFGTDDNGLPTEKLIEKINKVKNTDFSRADFIKLCLKTISEIKSDFIEDWKRLGISADYDKCYSTIDDKSRKISQKSFIDLFNKNEIYRAKFPVIWCCECQTSIAQAELEDKQFKSKFITIKFKIKENNKDLLIATTRPELLGACVAVFVNPEDKRFKDVVGKTAVVPLFGQNVPIIADKSANPDKGTGVLMICSYGDKFDVESINKYKLQSKIVFTNDGKINTGTYSGLSIKDARKKIIEDLVKKELILKQEDITHTVNVHDKCGTEIEFLPTTQWFIKIMDKKEKLIEQGNKIKWYPEYMHKRYDNWVKALEWDWNISRSRHFGIPIPLWTCEECGEIILAKESELPVDPIQKEKLCPKCNKKANPELMVLDTWATSSISPEIVSDLVDKKISVPLSLRPQAHDIIRTWAFYTIARSFMKEGKIPWKDIVISGNVSLNGEKMSKSKGNVIDPREVIKNYGSDALRYWAAGSTLGGDVDYQEKDLVSGKKIVNKIWNASKFVFMNLEDYNYSKPKKLEEIDKLFLAKVNESVSKITEAFEKYEYSVVKQELDKLFWKDFTATYLEIVKTRVYQSKGDPKLSAQYTLYQSLLKIIKMFAPIMPFITEEVYQTYLKDNEKERSIHLCNWPEIEKNKVDLKDFDIFVEVLEYVRRLKSDAKKSMKSEIRLTLPKETYKRLEKMLDDLKNVTCALEIKEGKELGLEFI